MLFAFLLLALPVLLFLLHFPVLQICGWLLTVLHRVSFLNSSYTLRCLKLCSDILSSLFVTTTAELRGLEGISNCHFHYASLLCRHVSVACWSV